MWRARGQGVKMYWGLHEVHTNVYRLPIRSTNIDIGRPWRILTEFDSQSEWLVIAQVTCWFNIDRSKSNLITVLSVHHHNLSPPCFPFSLAYPGPHCWRQCLWQHWCIVHTPETCTSAEVCCVGGSTTEVLLWLPVVTFLMPHSLGSSLYARY